MKHLCFRLVTFFLHVKPDLLILVSIVKVLQIYFKTLFNLLLLVNVRVCNVSLRLIYLFIKEKRSDLSYKVCVPNKTEDLNLSVCNIITGINESKTLTKHVS